MQRESRERMKLYVVGAGYVGLVTAAAFASLGHQVICADSNEAKIAKLKAGHVPIYEPGLADLISAACKAGRLAFCCGTGAEIASAQAVFIAVSTPSRPDGRADLSYVLDAVHHMAPNLAQGCVLVTKSTVPVGTGDLIEHVLAGSAPDKAIAVVSNPEFLREGEAINDFLSPDRIIVGAETARGADILRQIYAPVLTGSVPFVVTRRRTAELIKYASNSFLATKLGFINEIADLCERIGADITEVACGMGLDHRIGAAFLNAGPGFGGSCFPKDALALINTANDHGMAMPIVERVVHANDMRKRNIARKVLGALGGSVRGKTIAVLGLAFKPRTDDMREAPAIEIVRTLDYWGASIRAYDPAAMVQAAESLASASITYTSDAYTCAEGADAAVIVTEWDEFRSLDLARLAGYMKRPVLVDLRNAIIPDAAIAAGFQYVGVGRGEPAASRDTSPATHSLHNAPAGLRFLPDMTQGYRTEPAPVM